MQVWKQKIAIKSQIEKSSIYWDTTACSLRHTLSSLAWKPGSWVRIPLRAWMFSVSVFAFFCVCVQVERPCDELITRPRSPTVCLRLRKLKWNGESFMEVGQVPIGGRSAIGKKKCRQMLKSNRCDFWSIGINNSDRFLWKRWLNTAKKNISTEFEKSWLSLVTSCLPWQPLAPPLPRLGTNTLHQLSFLSPGESSRCLDTRTHLKK
jgi:hypothetical protein